MRPAMIAKALKMLIPNKHNVLLVGQPGCGKTAIVNQVAQSLIHEKDGKPYDLLVLHPVVDEPIDYKGLPFVEKSGADFKPFGNLRRMIDAKRPLIVFFDDLGQAPVAVQAALMQILYGGTINGVKISPHVRFVGATNDHRHRAGVTGLLEPVKSRFSTILNVDINLRDWQDFAIQDGTPVELVAFTEMRPDVLTDFEPTAEMTNSACPRTLSEYGRILNDGFLDALTSNELSGFDSKNVQNSSEMVGMLYELTAGAVGHRWAPEIVGFIKVAKEMVDPKTVLKAPMQVTLPEKRDALIMLTAAVANAATKSTVANFAKFVNRLSKEMVVFAWEFAITANPELRRTKEFTTEYLVKHEDVLIQHDV